jgi:hypothetical protein
LYFDPLGLVRYTCSRLNDRVSMERTNKARLVTEFAVVNYFRFLSRCSANVFTDCFVLYNGKSRFAVDDNPNRVAGFIENFFPAFIYL